MENIIIDNGSDSDLMEFQKMYDSIKPLKRITCFFDNENFLLTEYNIENLGIHMVIETYVNQQIHLGLNCGYGGHGPNKTRRLLELTGISKEDAEWLRLLDGFEVQFEENGSYYAKSIRPFFQKVRYTPVTPFHVDDYSIVYIKERRIMMLNPQINNMKGLFNCISAMKPREMEYFIGSQSPLFNGYRYKRNPLHAFRKYDKVKGLEGINLIIKGDKFDVYCLINKEEMVSVINAVYLCIFKKPLFSERYFGEYIFLTRAGNKHRYLNFIKSLFYLKEIYFHDVITIPEENRGITGGRL